MLLFEKSVEFFKSKNFAELEKLISGLCRYERKEVLIALNNKFGVDEVTKSINDSFKASGLSKSLVGCN